MGDAADDMLEGLFRHMHNNDEFHEDEEYVYCRVEFKASTQSAVLVAQHSNEFWIPRSLLSWKSDQRVKSLKRGDSWEMQVKTWKVIQEGILYD